MAVRITCISKANGHHDEPHEAISDPGWINEQDNATWRSGRLEMHKWVKEGGQAYVRDAYGNTAYLVAKVSAHGNPFVQTVADGRPTDNLLRLTECR